LVLQSEITKNERARMISEIKTVIGVLEASLEERSKDLAEQSQALKSQQKEFSQATARAQADRQAMVRAATQTVNAQLLGLQDMLDTLERGQPADAESVPSGTAGAAKKKTAKTKDLESVVASASSEKKADDESVSKSPLSVKSGPEKTVMSNKGSTGSNSKKKVGKNLAKKADGKEKTSAGTVTEDTSSKPSVAQKAKESKQK